jgi:hypothetical protein
MNLPQKAQSPGATGQSADTKQNNSIVGQTPADRKRIETLKARYALQEFAKRMGVAE